MVPVLHSMSKEMKENINELKIKVFNDDVNLYLNPTEGILASKNTPVWTVSSNPEAPEGLQYKQVPKVCVFQLLYLYNSKKKYARWSYEKMSFLLLSSRHRLWIL